MDDDYTPFESFTASEGEDGAEWEISWGERSRTTTLPAIAWFAENYDEEATVEVIQ